MLRCTHSLPSVQFHHVYPTSPKTASDPTPNAKRTVLRESKCFSFPGMPVKRSSKTVPPEHLLQRDVQTVKHLAICRTHACIPTTTSLLCRRQRDGKTGYPWAPPRGGDSCVTPPAEGGGTPGHYAWPPTQQTAHTPLVPSASARYLVHSVPRATLMAVSSPPHAHCAGGGGATGYPYAPPGGGGAYPAPGYPPGGGGAPYGYPPGGDGAP